MHDDPIESLLAEGEEVLWSGGPRRGPWVLAGAGLSVMGAIWLILPTGILLLTCGPIAEGSELGAVGMRLMLIPFFLAGLALLLTPLFKRLGHPKVRYLITDRRLILTGGLGSRNLKAVELDQVKNVALTTSLADRPYGTGTLSFFGGELVPRGHRVVSHYERFRNIERPLEVLKLAQERIARARREGGG